MRQERRRRLLQAWCLSLLGILIILAGRFDVTAADSTQARVRVLIAVSDTQGLTIAVGGGHLADNAPYRTLSAYQSLTQGQYNFSVYPSDHTDAASTLYTRAVTLAGSKDYTLVLYGTQANKELTVTTDVDDNTTDASKARIRFGNLQRGAGSVALATQRTNVILGQAKYGQTAEYTALDPGTYSLFVNGSDSKVVTTADVNFAPGTAVSIFLLGPSSDSGASALLINVDGGTGGGVAVSTAASPTASTASTASATAAASGTSPASSAQPTRTGPTRTPPSGYTFSYVTNTPGPGGGQTGGNTGDFPTSTPTGATGNATPTIPLGTAAPVPGEIASAALRRAALPVPPCPGNPNCAWFTQTNHAVANGFKVFWDKNGGQQRYGLPLTEEYRDASLIDGKVRVVQYFERTRLEYFPENQGHVGEVQETSLGREVLRLLGIAG